MAHLRASHDSEQCAGKLIFSFLSIRICRISVGGMFLRGAEEISPTHTN
jgi:hypothetical protein